MSEPKYTPGPWTYGPAHNYTGFWIAPIHTLPTLAAVQLVNKHNVTVECFNFPGKTEANARLIAKCPEMLEMLKKLVTCDCSLNPKGGFILRLPRSMESELIALIREAEGE